jgi:mannose-6-phosphate isomerase-like protein (cupin superfamily)
VGCALLMLAGVCTGCAGPPHNPRISLHYAGTPADFHLDTFVARNPIPSGQNILAVELGRTQSVSHHIVQIRDRERPHAHERHDLTVVILRGGGELMVGRVPFEMQIGDAAFVPRGRPHFFRNGGTDPAVALVTFSPPFDGTDHVAVEE